MADESKSKTEMKNEIARLQQQNVELRKQLASKLASNPNTQHNLLFSLFNNAPYGVFVVDMEKSLFVNPVGTEITGYSLEDVPTVEACFQTLFPDNEYQKLVRRRWWIDLKHKSNRFKRQFQVTCKNGKVKTLEFKIYPINNGTILVIFNDITPQIQEHKALLISEAQYRTIFEHNRTAMIVVDADDTILLANKKFTSLSGFSRSEIEGEKMWTEFIVADDQPLILDYHPDKLPGDGSEIEFRFIDNRQNIKHILATISPIPKTKHRAVSFMDLTSLKHALLQQESHIDTLKKALKDAKILTGLLPICAFCKKVRDDQGDWKQVETYIEENSQLEFTHSICPDCGKKLYTDYQIEEE